METEYNSKLISKLYNEKNQHKIIEILSEMKEIKDPLFLYPIYDNYKTNLLSNNSSISHYFINALDSLQTNSSDLINIVKEIFSNQKIHLGDALYCLDIFNKLKYYETSSIDRTIRLINEYIVGYNEEYNDEYEVSCLISYLEKAEVLNKIENQMHVLIFDNKFTYNIRSTVLIKWLNNNTKEKMQEIIDKFDNLKDDHDIMKALSKTIISWTGAKPEEIKTLIKASNNSFAKHIIEEHERKTKKMQQEKLEEQIKVAETNYLNAEIVEKICNIRTQINTYSSSSSIGLSIFNDNEKITLQIRNATSLNELQSSLMELRIVLNSFNEHLIDHGLSIEKIKELLPDTEPGDYSKPLNKLFLFLYSKGLNVGPELCGLRKLNHTISILGSHPNELKPNEIDKVIMEQYRSNDYYSLHSKILNIYFESLKELLEIIKKV